MIAAAPDSALTVHHERHWLRLESASSRAGAPAGAFDPAGMLGHPGLWRPDEAGAGGTAVFEVPRSAWALRGDEAATERRAEACVEWARATLGGRPPAGWRAPPLEVLHDLVPAGATTVRSGSDVRECAVEREDRRLALRCPIVPAIPADLPAARRAWLEALVRDARHVWRMARVGLVEGRAVVAEIDLTGAPPDILEAIVPAAVHGLRWVASWAATSAAVIVSGACASALAVEPA